MEEYSTMGGYYPFPSTFDAVATGVASAAPLPFENHDDDGNWTTFYGGAGLLSDALLYRPTKNINTSTAELDNSSGLPKLRPDSDSPCTIERLPWSLRFGEGEEEDGELDDGVSAIPSSCGDSIWNMSSGESEGNTTHMNTTTITQPNYAPNPNEAISLPSNKRPSSRGNSNVATFEITFGRPEAKRSRLPEENPAHVETASSRSIDFRHQSEKEEIDPEALAQVKEMIYRAAAFRPVVLGAEETVEKPKRKNVRISSDPQTVAARHRRERISERLRVLQRLVPGGSKLDTATMLDEAANYLKFLKSQVMALEKNGGSTAAGNDVIACGLLANAATSAAPSALSSTLTSTFLPQPPARINPNVRGSM